MSTTSYPSRSDRTTQFQNTDNRSLVALRDVYKIYGTGETQVKALNGINLDLHIGTFTAIVGPSGSGKSTLLHMLAGLDQVSSGTIYVAGKNITAMKDKELSQFRRDHIGFIFQSFNLIPTLTAEENIMLPHHLAGRKINKHWFEQIVHTLGIEDRLSHKPTQLSGGQQQRVAIARAIGTKPAMLVADEPTGNLDSKSSQEVISLLKHSVEALGQSLIMVTHDVNIATQANRILVVKDGQITKDLTNPTSNDIIQEI